jgi:hypothetical protein
LDSHVARRRIGEFRDRLDRVAAFQSRPRGDAVRVRAQDLLLAALLAQSHAKPILDDLPVRPPLQRVVIEQDAQNRHHRGQADRRHSADEQGREDRRDHHPPVRQQESARAEEFAGLLLLAGRFSGGWGRCGLGHRVLRDRN